MMYHFINGNLSETSMRKQIKIYFASDKPPANDYCVDEFHDTGSADH